MPVSLREQGKKLWEKRAGINIIITRGGAERILLAHAGLPRPGMCSGHYPGLAGFWKRQSAVPRWAPKCLSLSN